MSKEFTAPKFADRIIDLQEYIFSRLAKEKAKVELESGRKVLDFGAGSPDVKQSNVYIEKHGEFATLPDAHLYPGYGAIPEFSNGLIHWYKNEHDVSLNKDELYPLLGAKEGIVLLPLVILNDGEKVLVPDPGYPPFREPPEMFIKDPVVNYGLSEKNDFRIDFEELREKVADKTKFMWVNFPSNPTGQVATKEELEKLIDFARNHNIYIAYDNAYSHITFDGFKAPSILEIEGAKEVAIEIGSFSKTFSFAGDRMGWIVGNKNIISGLAKIKSQMDSGMSKTLQRKGAYALTNFDKDWYKDTITTYKKRRDVIAEKLKTLGLEFTLPKGSLYIWAKIPDSEESSVVFCEKLLRERQILLTPGSAYGKNGERYVRVSICVNVDKIHEYF